MIEGTSITLYHILKATEYSSVWILVILFYDCVTVSLAGGKEIYVTAYFNFP